VNRLGSIYGQPHQKPVLPEKACPFFGKAETICLNGVVAVHTGLGIFPFQFHKAPEEVKTYQSRLAALEHEGDHSAGRNQPESFTDDSFGCILGHNTHVFLRSIIGNVFIETVSAPHIAKTGCGLD
jgi:hypothetical protein